MFSFLDKLHNESHETKPLAIEKPKDRQGKIDEIKQYKRDYYIRNYERYQERNRIASQERSQKRSNPKDFFL